MRKKRLAIVYDAIYPYVKGGSEKRNYELGTRLARAGYEVHIYGMKWWRGEDVIRQDNLYLHGICAPKNLYTASGRRSIWQAIYFGLNCLKLIKEDFDIMDVNQVPYFTLFSARLVTTIKRKKMYATWSEVWGKEYWKEYLGKLGNIAYLVERLSSLMPDKIICVSEHTKYKLLHDLKVRQKISVIPNGIDFTSIQKVKPAQEQSDIIFAGRLISHKNVDLLIKSVAILQKNYPKIKVLVIGDGPEKMRVYNLINELGLDTNIKLLTFFDRHSDLYAHIKSSKIFAFPSSREGFGIVALEANACGIPFVTADHESNATKCLINGKGNGYLATLSSKSFAENIDHILSNHDEQRKDGCQDYAKNFSWDNICCIYKCAIEN